MNKILIRIPKFGQVAIVLSAATAGVVAARYLESRKINGAERLSDALLRTQKLRDAAEKLPEATAQVLAACAAYFVDVAFQAAEGLGSAAKTEDPTGYSRTHTHPYTGAAVTVLTEATGTEQLLTYAVTIPETGEVRGTRRGGGMKISGLSPARPTPDVAQISLKHDYSAQIETEFEVADYLLTGKTRMFGKAHLRDNQGNVAQITIGYDGAISGSVTRDNRVIGRFDGKVAEGLNFKQFEIEGGG